MNDYDNMLTSDGRSRAHLQIAAAYVKVAMRSSLTIEGKNKQSSETKVEGNLMRTFDYAAFSKRMWDTEILNICPTISRSSVEAGLREMIANDEIKRFGTGRATYYLRSDALE